MGLGDGVSFWSKHAAIAVEVEVESKDTALLLSLGFCDNATGVLYRLCRVGSERREGWSWESGGILVLVVIESCSCARTSLMVERRPAME